MRRAALIIMAIACATAIIAPTSADADGRRGTFEIQLSGGLAFPTGALKEPIDRTTDFEALPTDGVGADMKTGRSFTAGVDYFVSDDLAIGVDLGYMGMAMRDQVFSGRSYEELVTLRNLVWGAHGRYLWPSRGAITPYVSLGLAWYARGGEISSQMQALTDADRTDSEDAKLGIAAGLGADYRVNPRLALGLRVTQDWTLGDYRDDIWGTGSKVTVFEDWRYVRLDAVMTFSLPRR